MREHTGESVALLLSLSPSETTLFYCFINLKKYLIFILDLLTTNVLTTLFWIS